MEKYKDLKEAYFGRLWVLRPSNAKSSAGYKYWMCRCACGKIVEVRGTNLRSGATKSCGCMRGRRTNHQKKFVSISMYSSSLAHGFWKDRIEFTGDFTDSISAGELSYMVCEHAMSEGFGIDQKDGKVDLPTWDDLLATMPLDMNRYNVELYDGSPTDNGDIYGIRWL